MELCTAHCNRNRNRNLQISRAPTKAKSQEPAYSQALNQNKIDRQRSISRESGRQADSQTAMVDGVWHLYGEGGTRKTINQDRICQRAVFLVWSERAERRWLYPYGESL